MKNWPPLGQQPITKLRKRLAEQWILHALQRGLNACGGLQTRFQGSNYLNLFKVGKLPFIRGCTVVAALGAKRKEPPVNNPISTAAPLRATAPTPVSGIHLAHSSTPVVQRDRLIRLGQVEDLTGLKKSSIYAMVKDGTFPRQVVLSRRCSVWSESAVLTWVQAHITASQGTPLREGA